MISLTLPYQRSPLHTPRRDLVLAASDSLTLRVTVVQSDNPDAAPLLLTGGLGGPALRMIVRRTTPGLHPDYGHYAQHFGVLGVIDASVVTGTPGTFALVLAMSAMACWPPRCYFEIQLNNAASGASHILAHGMLHVFGGAAATYSEIPLLTDDSDPVLSDDAVALDIV
jgi:hypothetical protein